MIDKILAFTESDTAACIYHGCIFAFFLAFAACVLRICMMAL